jgi:6-phosphofructokinase 1
VAAQAVSTGFWVAAWAYAAVNALISGKSQQMMVGLEANHIVLTELEEALTQHQFKLEDDLMQMMEILSISI